VTQTNPFEKNLVAIQARLQVHLGSFLKPNGVVAASHIKQWINAESSPNKHFPVFVKHLGDLLHSRCRIIHNHVVLAGHGKIIDI
jgi:hypothetical protein